MYQALFTLDKQTTYSSNDTEAFNMLRRWGCFWKENITGFKTFTTRSTFLAAFDSKQQYLITLNMLKPRNPRIVGVWGQKGYQQGYALKQVIYYTEPEAIIDDSKDSDIEYTEPEAIVSMEVVRTDEPIWHPFDKSYYTYLLADVTEYDEKTEEFITHRPASTTQVENLAGWKPRDLTDYGDKE